MLLLRCARRRAAAVPPRLAARPGPTTTHCLLLTAYYYSLLTTHSLLRPTHYSLTTPRLDQTPLQQFYAAVRDAGAAGVLNPQLRKALAIDDKHGHRIKALLEQVS